MGHAYCSYTSDGRYAHAEQYLLPTTEDLFATLAGGVKLSKLDMVHAYQQILIDDDSKQYLHRGLFIYNRLAFGVSLVSAIFQRVIEKLLPGIPHTVYLDDILVTGVTKREHQANVKDVLRRLEEAGLRLKKDKCNFSVEAME